MSDYLHLQPDEIKPIDQATSVPGATAPPSNSHIYVPNILIDGPPYHHVTPLQRISLYLMELPSRGGSALSIAQGQKILDRAQRIYDARATESSNLASAAYELRALRESIMALCESEEPAELTFAARVHELSAVISLALREDAQGETLKCLNRLVGTFHHILAS